MVLLYPGHGGLHQQPGQALTPELRRDLCVPDVNTVGLSLVQENTLPANLNRGTSQLCSSSLSLNLRQGDGELLLLRPVLHPQLRLVELGWTHLQKTNNTAHSRADRAASTNCHSNSEESSSHATSQ